MEELAGLAHIREAEKEAKGGGGGQVDRGEAGERSSYVVEHGLRVLAPRARGTYPCAP